jgi:capsular exopolysaccharide synthesis family protein
VLLIDTDLRRPRLHRVFELPADPGLSSYLSGMEELPLPLRTPLPGVDLLPSGPIPPNPSELLNAAFFSTLAAHPSLAVYDHLVFDTPPVLSVSDPVVAARAMDAVVVVVRAGRTVRESLRAAVDRIRQVGARPTGVVLNDLDPASHGGPAYGSYGHYESVVTEQAPPRAAV